MRRLRPTAVASYACIRGVFALAVFASAGCGGSGSKTVPTSTELKLTPSLGYNGLRTSLAGVSATTVSEGGKTTIRVEKDNRTLRIVVPVESVASGQTFTVNSSAGVSATYSEGGTGSTVLTWAGDGGTVTILGTGSGTAQIRVTGVNFEADATVTGNGAAGTFALSGTVGGVPVNGTGGYGGSASATFTNPNSTNADQTAMATGGLAYAVVEGQAVLTANQTRGSVLRTIAVTMLSTTKAGDSIGLSGVTNIRAFVTYTEKRSSSTRVWIARSGSLSIRTKTATTAKVDLTNVDFEPSTLLAENAATGTFRLNATATRQ